MSQANGAVARPPLEKGFIEPDRECNIDCIPDELKTRQQWFNWTTRPDDRGKYVKIPIQAALPYRLFNTPAKSNDPATWSPFDEAAEGVRCGYGLAWVFSADDPYTGVDLDNCVNPETGEIDPAACEIVERFATYSEVSPSGTGIKMICRGVIERALSGDCDGVNVEVYAWKRFWTMTGRVLDGLTKIADAQQGLDWIYSRLKPEEQNGHEPRRQYECNGQVDREETRAALAALNSSRADDRQEWVKVGMALKAADPGLLADWDAWSQRSAKYRAGECAQKWESFRGNGVGIGTLFHLASQDSPGWRRKLAASVTPMDRGRRRARRPAGKPENGKPTAQEDDTDGERPALRAFPLIPLGEALNGSAPPEPDYLINGVLVGDQPFIVGGDEKTLKTHIAADLGYALASGEPFLGRFPVLERARVLFMSGESGEATLRRILYDVHAARTQRGWRGSRGLLLPRSPRWDDRGLRMAFSPVVPLLDSQAELMALEETLKRMQEEEIAAWHADGDYRRTVLIIDTASQAMPGDNASNGMLMQNILYGVAPLCHRYGVTMGLVHHFHRRKNVLDVPTIADLTMAGFKEWVRQWILVGRRLPYVPPDDPPPVEHRDEYGDVEWIEAPEGNPRIHELWLQCGGSAGHSSLWGLHVNEGTKKRPWWRVSLTPGSQVERAEPTSARRGRNANQANDPTAGVNRQVLDHLRATPEGNTNKGIREAIKRNKDSVQKSVEMLAAEGLIVPSKVMKNGRNEDGWIAATKAEVEEE